LKTPSKTPREAFFSFTRSLLLRVQKLFSFSNHHIMKDYEFDHRTYEQESNDKLQTSFKETDPEEGFRLTVSILSEKYGDSKYVKSLNVSAEDFFKSFDQVTSEKFVAMANRFLTL